ncbi:MAG: response regulator [Armatimonadota bacterium]
MSNRDRARVLVVDDDEGVRAVCEEILARSGCEVVAADCAETAFELMQTDEFDAFVVDLVLPGINGLGVLRRARNIHPSAVTIVITGYASLDTAMEAVRLGAYDYIRKPFEAEELLGVVRRGLKQRELAQRNEQLLEELDATNQQLLETKQQLENRVQMTSEKLETFIELGQQLATSDGVLSSLTHIVRAAVQLSGAKTGAIFVRANDGYDCVFALGEARSDLENVHLQAGEYALQKTVSGHGPVQVENLLASREEPNDLGMLGLASSMALPLTHQQRQGDVLALFDHPEPQVREMEMSLLRVLAAQAAGLLETVELRYRAGDQTTDGFVEISEML